MAMQEIRLTAESRCGSCNGTGIREWREVAPGERIMIGGHTPSVKRRQLCTCVKSTPVGPVRCAECGLQNLHKPDCSRGGT